MSVPPPVLDLDVGLDATHLPHFEWHETVKIGRRYGTFWTELRIPEIIQEQLAALSSGPLRFVEANPGSVFHEDLLNWPLSEINFKLDEVKGSVHGDIPIRHIRRQAEPFFLALIHVQNEVGQVVADLWLEIEFQLQN